jgi:endonuclease-3 related protein
VGAGNNTLDGVYATLLDYYGMPAWWPAEDDFEVMVGAILTQNTAWPNVEKAIANLKQQDHCNPQSLAKLELDELAGLIRPSGYFNQKARRLRGFAAWYLEQGGHAPLAQLDTAELRARLLALHGIGDETADDIVLYAFHKPSFVVDAYTRRIFSRLGFLHGKEKYLEIQKMFHDKLEREVPLYNRYHALIVSHAKRHCMKRPDCSGCPLHSGCRYEAQA